MADLEFITKGIVQAINSYSQKMDMQSQMQNLKLMEEVKKGRAKELRSDKSVEKYNDPMQRIYAQQYLGENPQQAGEFEDVYGGQPWYEKLKTQPEQPQAKPPTIGQPKMKIEPSKGGFKAVETKPSLDEDIKSIQAGEGDYESLYKAYPTKRTQINKTREAGLNQNAKYVLDQLKDILNPDSYEGGPLGDYKASAGDAINTLIEGKDQLTASGVDVDEILSILDIDAEEIERYQNAPEEEKPNILQRMLKGLGAMTKSAVFGEE